MSRTAVYPISGCPWCQLRLLYPYIGCAVWAYKDWLDELFPPDSKSADLLSLYSRRLTTVEGNTTLDERTNKHIAVHPHGRGDGSAMTRRKPRQRGSPPRTWGRRWREVSDAQAIRFTPTCVGTTYLHSPSPRRPPVHPHGRGDDEVASKTQTRAVGSPPRAWGRPPRD